MSGPENSGQGWSLETLKEHFDAMMDASDRRYEQRFADTKTAVDAALSAAKEAVIKAEGAADKRFEGVNEFRATLADQQRTLMPRAETEALNKLAADRLSKLEGFGLGAAGQQIGTKAGYVWAIGTVAVLGTILAAVAAIRSFIQ